MWRAGIAAFSALGVTLAASEGPRVAPGVLTTPMERVSTPSLISVNLWGETSETETSDSLSAVRDWRLY